MNVTAAVMAKIHTPDMTNEQTTRAGQDIKEVCEMFSDGYDRARALEVGFHWQNIDAEMVSILDGVKTC